MLRREGIDVGREQTARLICRAGVTGKGKSPIIKRKPSVPDMHTDLVKRQLRADGSGRLGVADITYLRTKTWFVYASFVPDAFSRKIVDWALSDSMRTDALLLQALNQAIVSAKKTQALVRT